MGCRCVSSPQSTRSRALRATIACVLLTPLAQAQKIYFADLNALKRVNTDGTELETLISSPLSNPDGVAIDAAAGKLYWADSSTGSIKRVDVKGAGVEAIVQTAPYSPGQIALDSVRGKLYWCDVAFINFDWYGRIARANLDGTNVEILVPSIPNPLSGIALDLKGARIYGVINGAIARWEMNGANQESLVPSACASHIALDAGAGLMYWAGCGRIGRATLNGSAVTTLVTALNIPHGIALDVGAGKIYWTDAGLRKVQRANLDGSQVEDVTNTGSGMARGIALDVQGERMYWGAAGRIRSATMDGSDASDVLVAPIHESYGLAIDRFGGKVYWTNRYMGEVRRAALNGANVEPLFTGLNEPWGIAFLDASPAFFVTDIAEQKLWRVDLDGNCPFVLPFTAAYPKGIALDNDQQRLFLGTSSGIKSCDLDGLDSQTLISTGIAPFAAIALDPPRGHMYWTESNKIKRANMDGSGLQDAITRSVPHSGVLYRPVGLVVDPLAGKLYWTDQDFGLREANLDGTADWTLTNESPRFMSALALDARTPADRNDDGSVDLHDLASFQNCFSGNGVATTDTACSFFDLYPADFDVDLVDYKGFFSAFSSD